MPRHPYRDRLEPPRIFKYLNFTILSVNRVGDIFGAAFQLPMFDIILPIGISFYTFHTISYIVDGYRRIVQPTRNVFEFSCYVSLFSQLVAGPLLVSGRSRRTWRTSACVTDRRSTSWVVVLHHRHDQEGPDRGQYRCRHRSGVELVPGSLTFCQAWLCALGYTYQLYFDFSGYSDMAVGLGISSTSISRKISTRLTRLTALPTSGGAGTFHSRTVFATIYTSPSEAIEGVRCEPTAISC